MTTRNFTIHDVVISGDYWYVITDYNQVNKTFKLKNIAHHNIITAEANDMRYLWEDYPVGLQPKGLKVG